MPCWPDRSADGGFAILPSTPLSNSILSRRSVNAGVIPLEFMQQITLRYLLTCVALIAACLALATLPSLTFGPNDGGSGVPYSHIINLQTIGYYAAASTFMHLFCTIMQLKGLLRWAVSILTPSLAMLGWHLWWIAKIEQEQIHYPISITPTEVFVFNLIAFTICFTVVSGVMASFGRITRPQRPIAG